MGLSTRSSVHLHATGQAANEVHAIEERQLGRRIRPELCPLFSPYQCYCEVMRLKATFGTGGCGGSILGRRVLLSSSLRVVLDKMAGQGASTALQKDEGPDTIEQRPQYRHGDCTIIIASRLEQCPDDEQMAAIRSPTSTLTTTRTPRRPGSPRSVVLSNRGCTSHRRNNLVIP